MVEWFRSEVRKTERAVKELGKLNHRKCGTRRNYSIAVVKQNICQCERQNIELNKGAADDAMFVKRGCNG